MFYNGNVLGLSHVSVRFCVLIPSLLLCKTSCAIFLIGVVPTFLSFARAGTRPAPTGFCSCFIAFVTLSFSVGLRMLKCLTLVLLRKTLGFAFLHSMFIVLE